MSGIAALRILSVLLAVTGTLIVTATASAHPHILPKVKTNLVFSPDGHVTAIQHTWLYDSAYSTFVGRDIDVNKDGITSKDELVAFGRKQIDALAEHSYFTTVTTQAGVVELDRLDSYDVDKHEDGRIQLKFSVRLKTVAPVEKTLTVDLFDPNFFAYFTMVDDGVKLIGAPHGCALAVTGPQPIDLKNTRIIPAGFWQALDGSKSAALQFVNRITVTCP